MSEVLQRKSSADEPALDHNPSSRFRDMELRYIEHSHGFERSSRHDMALGKRRRREKLKFLEAAEETAPDPRVPDLQALLQKHFEANFEPLPNVHTTENGDASQRFLANDSDTSDWEGISDDEAPYPETISHDQGATATEDICESELKAFMVSIALRFGIIAANLTSLITGRATSCRHGCA